MSIIAIAHLPRVRYFFIGTAEILAFIIYFLINIYYL
jgi:hypothetical protein